MKTNIKKRSEFRLSMFLVWPLLLGIFMIMVGNGLQGTLLSLRAEHDGFSISLIGAMMSLYYCGYLAGCKIVPSLINSVGHIRVFAGFASLASSTILLHGVFVDPVIWCIVRFISGMCFVGLFIVAESWLNNIATNRLRGQILSAYILALNGGLFAGQFLINLAPIEAIGLFILVSVLISLSLVPITLAGKSSPTFEEVEKLPLRKMMSISPFSVACVFTSGFASAGMLTLAPIYALSLDYSIAQLSAFMGLYVFGTSVLPLFFGWLSDKIERRKILILIAMLCATSCTIAYALPWALLWIIILIGGCITSCYSIGVAMMNDRLKSAQITSATASLIFVNGIGAAFAPLLLGAMMQQIGNDVFFMSFAGAFTILAVFGIYRAITGPEFSVEDQGEYQTIPSRSSPSIAQIAEDD